MAELAQEAEAAELSGGKDDFFDEGVAGLVHDRALQVFFGAKVGEQAALADAQGRGELADGETFEAFQGSDIDGLAEDGAASFEAAGAARWKLDVSCLASWGCGTSLWAWGHLDALIIARPFVLLQLACNARSPCGRSRLGASCGWVT